MIRNEAFLVRVWKLLPNSSSIVQVSLGDFSHSRKSFNKSTVNMKVVSHQTVISRFKTVRLTGMRHGQVIFKPLILAKQRDHVTI